MNATELSVLKTIRDMVPAFHEGQFFVEHHDADGNYTGSHTIDPVSIIQGISQIVDEALNPKRGELFLAAEKVYTIRYDSSKEWDDLNAAIGELGSVLDKIREGKESE